MKILLMKVPEIDFEEREMNYSEVCLGLSPIPLGIASAFVIFKKHTDHEIILCDVFLEGFEEYSRTNDRQVFLKVIDSKSEMSILIF